MRILVVSQYFWPENFRINELVAELVARGHEVTVLTGRPNYPGGSVFREFKANPEAFSVYKGAQIIRAPLIPRGVGRGLKLIANYLSFVLTASIVGCWRLRRHEVDAVFVFEPSPVTVGLPAVLLGRLKRAPVAMWVLDLWPETLSAVGVVKSPALLGAVGRLVSFIYDRCALILVQSKAFVPTVLKYCRRPGSAEKVKYFPNWSEQVFKATDDEPAAEVPWRPDLFTVLFAGNVGEAQDFSAVLDAAERLKQNSQVRWVIVGHGRALDWVHSEVRRRGLTDVFLPGYFPLERMPSFFRHADALLVSLRRDPVFAMTIPGKAQSYLQAGIPIVGMLDGEGARIIEEAGAGLVCAAGDSDGLARAVVRLASMDPSARQAMGKKGVSYASQEFDRGTIISRLEVLLASTQPSRFVAGETLPQRRG